MATVMFNSQLQVKLNAGGTRLFTMSLLLWELESWVCPQLFHTWAGLVVWLSSSCHGLSLCTPCGSWSRCMRWMAAGMTSSTFRLHTCCPSPASNNFVRQLAHSCVCCSIFWLHILHCNCRLLVTPLVHLLQVQQVS